MAGRPIIWVGVVLVALMAGGAAAAAAAAATVTVGNHSGRDFVDELVRLKVELPAPYDAATLEVSEEGRPVAHQVEVIEGVPQAVHAGHVWVAASIPAGGSRTFVVKNGGKPRRFEPRVKLTRQGDHFILDNGLLAVKLPAKGGTNLVGPIAGVRLPDGRWAGASHWRTSLVFNSLHPRVEGDGTLFARVLLQYFFNDSEYGGGKVPFSFVTVTLKPGERVAHVEESHAMTETDAWALELSPGLAPDAGLLRGWCRGPTEADESLRTVALAPSPRLGDTLAFLQPRWTQGFDHGWFFAGVDAGRTAVLGAMAARAGRWDWPHDNLMRVRVGDGKDPRALRIELPTHRGSRSWLLAAGPMEVAAKAPEIVQRAALLPADKLVNEYDLDWPGGPPPGEFRAPFFYSNQATDPIGVQRRQGRELVRQWREGKLAADRQALGLFHAYMDPDWYGSYERHWSPINPGFATDFLKVPVVLAAALKDHPRHKTFAARVERAMRLDLAHSVTLPGGAGQGSPGATAHAMQQWLEMAEVARRDLGFDPATWPRWRPAASFLLRTSQPPTARSGGKRMILPLGDTHPPGPDVVELARRFGVEEDPRTWRSEELPGFGAVLRNHAGTDRETFLAFKAGPNRAHDHGDQLSFHYVAYGRRLAIDHMCADAPRAGQEHMHNRVCFSTDDLPYADVDGHERLIAFRASADADVAVGQVQSPRLRRRPKLPEEVGWDEKGPYHPFREGWLTYRRTAVLVKRPEGAPGRDYVVLLDEHRGPTVRSTFALHVESEQAERVGNRVDFGTMTLFLAEPKEAAFERFDWSFVNKDRAGCSERTSGVRFTTRGDRSRFVSVLYPDGGAAAPAMEAVPGGVRLTFAEGHTDAITFADQDGEGEAPRVTLTRDGKVTVLLRAADIDLARSQGDVGLFIPDVGYDLGPLPQWLIDQRLKSTR